MFRVKFPFVISILFGILLLFSAERCVALVANCGFEETYTREDTAAIEAMKKAGWEIPSPLVWPQGWQDSGVTMVNFAVVQDRPHSGKNCILLWGQSGSSGYLSTQAKELKKGIYKASFYGRGKGTATLMVGGMHIILNARMSEEWAEYAGIFRNTSANEANLTIQAQTAEVYFDDINLKECDILEAAQVEEGASLAKSGQLLSDSASPDKKAFQDKITEVINALPKLKVYVQADPIPETVELVRLLEERITGLNNMPGDLTVAQANLATVYASISRRLLTELYFEDAK